MKAIIPIIVVATAFGFTAGWFFKPNAQSLEAVSSEESIRSSTRAESSRVSRVENEPRPSVQSSVVVYGTDEDGKMDPEMRRAMEEAQGKQKKMANKRLKEKYDLRIIAIVKELGLNSEQEKALRSFYDKQLEKLSSMDALTMMSDPELLKDLAAAVRGDGLSEFMGDKLTLEQQEGLEEMEQRQKKNKVEGQAMKTLAKLQQNLDLTEEQENEVYGILLKESQDKLDKQTDADVVLRGYMANQGMSGFMGESDFGSVLQTQMASPDGVSGQGMMDQIASNRQKEIDRKVELMAPILNEVQLDQYRGQLKNAGGMFNMMIQAGEEQ